MLLMGLWKSKVSNTASVFKGLMIYIYIYTHAHTHIYMKTYFSMQNEMRTTSAFVIIS